MEANQLQEVIEKGFKDLRAELDEKFEKIDTQFADLRRDVQKAGDDAHLAHVSIENLATTSPCSAKANRHRWNDVSALLRYASQDSSASERRKKSGSAAESRTSS